MKFAVAAVLALAASPAALAEPRRALMQQTGVCDNPPCHQATGQPDFAMSFNNNLKSVAANGGAAGPAFAESFNNEWTPAEQSCVQSCQVQQKAAGEAHKFFDWKGCQAACFPADAPSQVSVTPAALAPSQAQALAALIAQQQAQQAAQEAQQVAEQLQQNLQQSQRDEQRKEDQQKKIAQQLQQQKQQQQQQKQQQQQQHQ